MTTTEHDSTETAPTEVAPFAALMIAIEVFAQAKYGLASERQVFSPSPEHTTALQEKRRECDNAWVAVGAAYKTYAAQVKDVPPPLADLLARLDVSSDY